MPVPSAAESQTGGIGCGTAGEEVGIVATIGYEHGSLFGPVGGGECHISPALPLFSGDAFEGPLGDEFCRVGCVHDYFMVTSIRGPRTSSQRFSAETL